MNILKGDCLGIICKHLFPRDILNLLDALECGHKISKIKEIYLESCLNYIDGWFRDYFGENYDTFRNKMIDSKAFVSGSLVLQSIIGENWDSSDVDIFFREKENLANEGGFKPLTIFLYALEGKYGRHHPVRSLKEKWERQRSYSPIKNEIHRILDYTFKTKKFQCIHLNVEKDSEVIDFINNFDFNFCKNVFYYDENGPHLLVPFFEDVFHKRTSIASVNQARSSPSRQEKYVKRGFVFA